MSMIRKKYLGSAFLAVSLLQAIPFLERSIFDINFRTRIQRVKTYELLVIPSIFLDASGRTYDGEKVNPLLYLAPTQDALAMLKGFPVGSIESEIAQQINVDDDDGIRGHFIPNGICTFDQVLISGSYRPAHEWFIRFRIPFTAMTVRNVEWKNLTQDVTYDDQLTQELVTDNFFNNVQSWGDLNLGDWSGKGFGDLNIFTQWERVFLQEKEWLKEVQVHAQLGVMVPVGKRKEENFALSLPFGNDGAWSIPFGAGIDLKIKNWARLGADVAFESVFSHTRNRRIMTDEAQTNYLLLQKAPALLEPGSVQFFLLFVEPHLSEKIAFRCAYQHVKHGKDRIAVLDNNFSSLIANKAQALQEWTNHSMLLQFRYDNRGERGIISPIISVFTIIPFNGKRSIDAPSLGFNLSLHF